MKLEQLIQSYKRKEKQLKIHAFKNRKELKTLRGSIQALEGAFDILTTYAASSSTNKEIRGNNYATYSQQINAIYEMYNGLSKYGSHITRGLVNIRTAFIGGEGMSVIADTPEAQAFIDDFIEFNKLNGSMLINLIKTGEMEGKCLMLLKTDNEAKQVAVRYFNYYTNPYYVQPNKDDNLKIEKVRYKPDANSSLELTIDLDKCTYVKLGGSPDKLNDTYTRIGTCLTQIENYDKALYDLRNNNHLFARLTPYWKTQNAQDAQVINNSLDNKEWSIGQGYAGPADFSLVGPDTGALDNINGEMLLNIKVIATVTGVPIHWVSWTEMLSNRATAENLLEVINASTKEERLIWIESFKDLIKKAMVLAVDNGYYGNEILTDNIQVKLPLVSLSSLIALQQTWLPLQQAGLLTNNNKMNTLVSVRTNSIVTGKQIGRASCRERVYVLV